MNLIIFVFDCICCVIGLPLNCYMVAMILFKKRLKRRAKNIFQLALALSDIFTLCVALVRTVYYLHPSEELCLIYISISGLAYILFFFNLLLSLVDRYVAMTRPIWHRNKVTVRFVILWLIVLNLVLCIAVKWVYISRMVPLRCKFRSSHSLSIQVIMAVELIACVAFHIAGYLKAKQMLQSSRTISVSTAAVNKDDMKKKKCSRSINKRRKEQRVEEEIEMKPLSFVHHHHPVDNKITIHRSKSSVANLEMKATRSFLIGVIPLLVLPCPMLLYSLSFNLICIPLYGGDKCGDFAWLYPYFRAVIGLHVLVYVIITVASNKDFSWPFSFSSCFCFWPKNNVNPDQLYG